MGRVLASFDKTICAVGWVCIGLPIVETINEEFVDLCSVIRDLAKTHPDWDLVYPVHLNPNVRKPVFEILRGLENVWLIEPLDYAPFVWLMNRSNLILTDAGGIQVEGLALDKPVLVLRNVTERPEAVEAETVLLMGTDTARIVACVERVISDAALYQSVAPVHNSYGDGHAVPKIIKALSEQLA